jgi:hypothetical protein
MIGASPFVGCSCFGRVVGGLRPRLIGRLRREAGLLGNGRGKGEEGEKRADRQRAAERNERLRHSWAPI